VSKLTPAKGSKEEKEEEEIKRQRIQREKSFAFCAMPWLVGSDVELSKCKLATEYTGKDRIVCITDGVDDEELHESRVALTVWEVGNHYVEVADAAVYKSVCALNSLHLNTKILQIRTCMLNFRGTFQNNLRDNASKLLKEFPDIPLNDISDIKKKSVRGSSEAFRDLLDHDPDVPTQWKLFPKLLRGGNPGDPLEEVMLRSEIIVKVSMMLLVTYLTTSRSTYRFLSWFYLVQHVLEKHHRIL
jgi:hypothetical protein